MSAALETAARDVLIHNGVDGASGGYRFAPSTLDQVAARALGVETPRRSLLSRWRARAKARFLAPREGVDPRVLTETGWGAVFAEDADPAVREALAPLLEHRRAQAGSVRPGRYRELTGRDGYRQGESAHRFLARHGAGPGPVDPDRLPYYLLLVGDPEAIPFTVQYQLDTAYAVGRLCFDRVEAYADYAAAVLAAERTPPVHRRRVALFAPRHQGDRATERCHDQLVVPLAERVRADAGDRFEVETLLAGDATRAGLQRLLAGNGVPQLLITGSHGLGFDRGEPRQLERQGALVCQGWLPQGSVRSLENAVFAGNDVGTASDLRGMVIVSFACYSAGTPENDDFALPGSEPAALAERPFVARLPQALLGRPNGALAFVGHVDRAWTYSFSWPGNDAHTEVFASTVRRLLAGHPIGSAVEFFNLRYMEMECALAQLRQRMALGIEPDLLDLGQMWTARTDARNLVIIGDPAVKLEAPAP